MAWEQAGDVRLAVLRDCEAPAEARLAPQLGGACVGYRVGPPGEGAWQVLAEPPDEEELVRNATRYGAPVLFPFPNRVRQGVFSFAGGTYRLEPNTPQGHHNHGLVRRRAWRLEEFGVDDGAWARCRIAAADFPDLLEQYPFPFLLDVTYRLRAGELRVEAAVENVGTSPLPMGFGLHPYFALPLGPSGRRERCEVRIPAEQYWELDRHLPTGATHAVFGNLDLRRFRALGANSYDDVFTDLEREDGEAVAALRDPLSGRRVEVRAGPEFREFVLYAPLERPVVAIEPYTCPTDAANLEARGIAAGLIVLEPGQRWQGGVSIRPVEEAAVA